MHVLSRFPKFQRLALWNASLRYFICPGHSGSLVCWVPERRPIRRCNIFSWTRGRVVTSLVPHEVVAMFNNGNTTLPSCSPLLCAFCVETGHRITRLFKRSVSRQVTVHYSGALVGKYSWHANLHNVMTITAVNNKSPWPLKPTMKLVFPASLTPPLSLLV